MTPSPTTRAVTFRPDIEGLRGIAVLAVVLFHAGLLGVAGGFVGVDVFFVLSGFLITGLLLREREERGSIRLVGFYARRVRRLVPAAVIVLGATLAAAWLLLDPLTRADVLVDGAAAALSASNVRFAITTGDYFAPVAAPSPFLQFWSLAVEEQFYLVWPLLIVAFARGQWPRATAGLIIAAVLGASFAANVLVTDQAPAWAFYSLPTRAWQLAAGGLLAVVAGALTRLPSLPVAVLGWSGLAAIGAAVVGFDGSIAYPGTAAVLPTLGAVGVIAGGARRFGPGAILATAPLRFLGRISYSLYLWHWPVLVLAPAVSLVTLAPDGTLPIGARIGLVGLAVIAASTSTLLVEEPIRFGLRPSPERRPARAGRRTLAAGIAVLAALAVTGSSLAAASLKQLEGLSASNGNPPAEVDPWWPVESPAASRVPSTPAPIRTLDPTPGATAAPATPAPTPTPAPVPNPTPVPVATPSPGVGSGPGLPADVRPPLASARLDEERLKADHCLAYEPATSAPSCAYGDPAATFTVALVGDSHGAHWFPAIEAVAKVRGWRVIPFVKVSCPFIDIAVTSRVLKREYTECAAFREATLATLNTLRPDLTIVAQSKWVTPLDEANGKVEIIGASLGRTVARVPGPVALMVDTPHAAEDVPACLAANLDDIAACATPKARAMWGTAAIEKVAAAAAGVPLIDLRSHVCVASPCPAVVNGMIVYRDAHHLTATFSRSLAPVLDAALRGFLPG